MTTIGSESEIIGNTSLRHAWCWLRGLGVQSPRLSQSSGLEICGTRVAMVSRWIKVTIKNDGWAVTPFWVMEQKAEPITTGSPSEWTIECINYEYLQYICKNKYFITCTKAVYIGMGMFVKRLVTCACCCLTPNLEPGNTATWILNINIYYFIIIIINMFIFIFCEQFHKTTTDNGRPTSSKHQSMEP